MTSRVNGQCSFSKGGEGVGTGYSKRVFVVFFGGGLFLILFFTLSKILLATKICQSGARKLAKL